MRHLLQILLESPRFFHVMGSVILCVSWLTLIIGLLYGPIRIGGASAFGVHSMLLGLLGSLFGITIWASGLFLSVSIESDIGLYRYIIDLPEDKLFWYAVGIGVISSGFIVAMFVSWGQHGYRFLALEKETVAVVGFASNGMLLVFNAITAHLLKRS